MASKITRQADAETLLLPAGWEWAQKPRLIRVDKIDPHTGQRTGGTTAGWDFGSLIPPDISNSNTVSRVAAQKALCEVVRDYDVEIRVAQFRSSGTFREVVNIHIKPMHTNMAEYYANQYLLPNDEEARVKRIKATATGLNIYGWEMSDGYKVPPGELMRDGKVLACNTCKRTHINLVTDPDNPAHHYCNRCVRVCPGNGTDACTVPIFQGSWHGCETHFPRGTCSNCKQEHELGRMQDYMGASYCRDCVLTICERCKKIGSYDPNNEAAVKDGKEYYRVCRSCKPGVLGWLSQDRNEIIILEKPVTMRLDAVEERPVRLASVELEIATGALDVLGKLRDRKLTRSQELAVYHRGDDTDFCYAEADGSLSETGGEIIFPKMRLDNPTTASKLSEAIGIIRSKIKKKDASIDLSTGCHVHIDAHKLGFNHIRNLVILHNFLEDPWYRISAANYTRHRGIHYAMMMPKSNLDSQADFNRHFFHYANPQDQHHSVLNVAYYYSAVANCQCGNIVGGAPELCNCQLGKCTVEFRVFNGTSSWKKLHAYLALCMSLVAYAGSTDELDIEDFPVCLYSAVGQIDSALHKDWVSRLVWMFENLWFSKEERESIQYCIEHSELSQLSYPDMQRVRKTEYKGTKYVMKKPRVKEVPPPDFRKRPALTFTDTMTARLASRRIDVLNPFATMPRQYQNVSWSITNNAEDVTGR